MIYIHQFELGLGYYIGDQAPPHITLSYGNLGSSQPHSLDDDTPRYPDNLQIPKLYHPCNYNTL